MQENKEKNSDKLIIIIPAFNEAQGIAKVIEDVHASFSQAEIVVVDDGSKDNTWESAGNSGATVLRLSTNMGYGAALQTGFRYAVENRYERAVIMDGDGQHLAGEIEKVLNPLLEEGYDLVIGSRYSGEKKYEGSFFRKLGSYLFAKLASLSLGFTVTDPTSGFQALSGRILRFFTTPVYPSDYPDADILIASKRNGFRIKEVSVAMKSNPSGKSMHSGLKPLYYIFKMFFSVFLTFLRKKDF